MLIEWLINIAQDGTRFNVDDSLLIKIEVAVQNPLLSNSTPATRSFQSTATSNFAPSLP